MSKETPVTLYAVVGKDGEPLRDIEGLDVYLDKEGAEAKCHAPDRVVKYLPESEVVSKDTLHGLEQYFYGQAEIHKIQALGSGYCAYEDAWKQIRKLTD